MVLVVLTNLISYAKQSASFYFVFLSLNNVHNARKQDYRISRFKTVIILVCTFHSVSKSLFFGTVSDFVRVSGRIET